LEIVLDQATGGNGEIPGGTIFRVLRVMRIVRTVRAIQTGAFFRDLRMMVQGMAEAVLALIWFAVLLLCVMMVFAILITHMVTEHMNDLFERKLPYDADSLVLAHNFGTLPKSLYSLLKTIAGGESWGLYSDALNHTSPVLGLSFLIYVFVVTFAVVNIAVGVFVDAACRTADNDQAAVAVEKYAKQQQLMEEFCKVFKQTDIDESGEMTRDEFILQASNPTVQSYFQFVELDVELYPPDRMFDLLDFDGSGAVDLNEFVTGLAKFHGQAKGLDMAFLHHDIRKLEKVVTECFSMLSDPRLAKEKSK